MGRKKPLLQAVAGQGKTGSLGAGSTSLQDAVILIRGVTPKLSSLGISGPLRPTRYLISPVSEPLPCPRRSIFAARSSIDEFRRQGVPSRSRNSDQPGPMCDGKISGSHAIIFQFNGTTLYRLVQIHRSLPIGVQPLRPFFFEVRKKFFYN